jgi:breast cancer 2 susceptibility protein
MEAIVITDSWVKNHWSLIVWKLGNMIKAKPDERSHWWTFEAVWHQLLYRYEREINRAERSAIKRIQEQDSPSQTPMVLLVSQIFWIDPPVEEPPPDNPDQLQVSDGPIASGFELTDGWYRMNAKVDPVLAYAAKRGKISVGTKIEMTGAKVR